MALENNCDHYIFPEMDRHQCNHLFHCGAGNKSFSVSYDGIFRMCADLWHPDCIYDLRKGTLKEAWEEFIPKVLQTTSNNPEFHSKCHSCNIINLCLWCPAHAYLESGELDKWVDSFCQVAHARQSGIENKTEK